jgi:hypothetical protein
MIELQALGSSRHRCRSVSEWVEEVFLALEGEEEEVDHPEGGVVGAEGGFEGGVADDRELARLDRAVERFGDDAGADAGEFSVVELGFAEDVEPKRRVREQGVSLRLGEGGEGVPLFPSRIWRS